MEFKNIDGFYEKYHKELLEEDTLRPCKSVPRNISEPIDKFMTLYFEKRKKIVSHNDVLNMLKLNDENDTYNTNIRAMKEFDLLVENGENYEFTNKFFKAIEEGIDADTLVLRHLMKISNINDINMVLNTILCTLREGYLYGTIISYPDGYDDFVKSVTDKNERIEYCKRVYKIYGFHGKNKEVEDDAYTPNANYRIITELRRLKLIEDCDASNSNNQLTYYKLSNKSIYILEKINKNLGMENKSNEASIESKINYLTGLKSKYSRNIIYFGAPGTGKSYQLNLDKNDLIENDKNKEANVNQYERVTFHPDYSYAQFVGTYKPMVKHASKNLSKDKQDIINVLTDKSKTADEKYNILYPKFKDDSLTRLPILLGLYCDDDFTTKKKDNSPAKNDNSVEKNHGKAIREYVNLINENTSDEITYEYVPGPFLRVYVKSLKNIKEHEKNNEIQIKPNLLVIEEINRANVAAVFGDVFQLLDRKNNISEYPINTSKDMRMYLASEFKDYGMNEADFNQLIIPDNMFIWATMNSADQGVYPMDTAFKRRWDFDYIGINKYAEGIKNKIINLPITNGIQTFKWDILRNAINNHMASKKINEDKQLGPYFISKTIVCPDDTDTIDAEKFSFAFKNKVLMYLFEDVFKSRPELIFNSFNGQLRYSTLCEQFDNVGLKIFNFKEIDDVIMNVDGNNVSNRGNQ